MFRRLAYSILAFVFAAVPAYADAIITGSIPNTFTPGTTISSAQMNANFQYIITQANANAAKNGVNSSITALSALTTPLTPSQGGTAIYVGPVTGGTANAITVSAVTPVGFSLTYGSTIRFTAIAANTGPTTLAVNGLAAAPVLKSFAGSNPLVLAGGELQPFQIIEAFYDGGSFHIISRTGEQYGGYGVLSSLAAAATTDLGSVPSHHINLTASAPTTITSFGTSASQFYPMYMVRQGSANTITINPGANLVTLGNAPITLQASSNDQILVADYGGVWYEVAYYPGAPRYTPVQANAVTIRNNTVTPSTKIDLTAKEIVLDSLFGASQYVDSFLGGGTCTIDLSVNGVGGLDMGVLAANTWYYVYAVGDGSVNTNCLASASATGPVLPIAWAFRVRLGAMHTGAGGVLDRSLQKGAHARWVATAGALPTTPGVIIGSGAVGVCSNTSTWAAAALVIPATATEVDISLFTGSNNAAVQANNGSPVFTNAPLSFAGTATAATMSATIPFESGNVYWCSTGASAQLQQTGWIDAVNAN